MFQITYRDPRTDTLTIDHRTTRERADALAKYLARRHHVLVEVQRLHCRPEGSPRFFSVPSCPDCGKAGERAGHQDCESPKDHA